jgi:hypothetical protein
MSAFETTFVNTMISCERDEVIVIGSRPERYAPGKAIPRLTLRKGCEVTETQLGYAIVFCLLGGDEQVMLNALKIYPTHQRLKRPNSTLLFFHYGLGRCHDRVCCRALSALHSEKSEDTRSA